MKLTMDELRGLLILIRDASTAAEHMYEARFNSLERRFADVTVNLAAMDGQLTRAIQGATTEPEIDYSLFDFEEIEQGIKELDE